MAHEKIFIKICNPFKWTVGWHIFCYSDTSSKKNNLSLICNPRKDVIGEKSISLSCLFNGSLIGIGKESLCAWLWGLNARMHATSIPSGTDLFRESVPPANILSHIFIFPVHWNCFKYAKKRPVHPASCCPNLCTLFTCMSRGPIHSSLTRGTKLPTKS